MASKLWLLSTILSREPCNAMIEETFSPEAIEILASWILDGFDKVETNGFDKVEQEGKTARRS